MAKKRGILDGYKTYDPAKEGYGSVSDWGRAFNETMGVEEAAAALGADNPLTILGLTDMPTLDVLKRVYRKLMLKYHPDVAGTGDADRAQKIIAAYTTLEDRIRRATR